MQAFDLGAGLAAHAGRGKGRVQHARADGSLQRLNSDYFGGGAGANELSAPTGAASRSFDKSTPARQGGKTRAEVKEELRRAHDSGELQNLRKTASVAAEPAEPAVWPLGELIPLARAATARPPRRLAI